jgi:hypothetical protein
MTDALLTIEVVAARLHKSKRWLQTRLAEDRRRPDPRLQFQTYIGKTPLWTESRYLALRGALEAESKKGGDQASLSSSGTASGTSTALSTSRDAESAFARVLAFRRNRRDGKKPTAKGTELRRKYVEKCEERPTQVLTFRSRQHGI